MIDWTEIIITMLTLFIGGGGIVTIVTLRDKKNAAMLDNIVTLIESNAKTNEEWKAIAAERAVRCGELKSDLDRKDNKIDTLYGDMTQMRNELDHTRTKCAVATLLKCTMVECGKRQPPLGSDKMDNENGNDIKELQLP